MIRAFIFDLDGVLTDTSEFHYLAWKRLADEEGIPFTREDNEALRGVSRHESLRLLLKGRTLPPAQFEEWAERKNRYYLELINQISPRNLLPGAVEFLQALQKAGLKRAIASSSKNARLVVERLNLLPWVDVLVDGTMVDRSKPAPDLFLKAAELLGEHPEACVVVEDAEAGIEAARAAGMRVIGIGPYERVGKADLVISGLNALGPEEILRRLERNA
ncbi:beta-phosphoglucomutase [Thermanaerothrix sp. 4228-RoL]|uniref:Beta-phosphoglucomutase n=1 Tax=Thermanaerothrix solaris TaxID=3058434 RepID=A0ABU3NL08_9CHLR|nr:beta-phosphoglucomutase [Thermanaerothrix sp. 4228-RoL]MDT8897514.1 beta-phosphoglucomutase [Thermanaerothrix sp. 4228-RoL]